MIPRLASAVLALAVAFAAPVAATEPALPTGTPILTLSGDIAVTNLGDTLVLDAAMLAELGTVTVETSTIWTEGVNRFEGVPLKTLVAAAGIEGGTLRASAINDYTVEIPVSDAVEDGPIVAFLMNGAPMSVRDKGPLWILYPFDQNPDYRSEVIYTRSIWQLDRIDAVR